MCVCVFHLPSRSRLTTIGPTPTAARGQFPLQPSRRPPNPSPNATRATTARSNEGTQPSHYSKAVSHLTYIHPTPSNTSLQPHPAARPTTTQGHNSTHLHKGSNKPPPPSTSSRLTLSSRHMSHPQAALPPTAAAITAAVARGETATLPCSSREPKRLRLPSWKKHARWGERASSPPQGTQRARGGASQASYHEGRGTSAEGIKPRRVREVQPFEPVVSHKPDHLA